MNTSIRTAAAALLMVAAGSGLVACGETVDVAPATSVRKEVKPQEHQGHKDLAETQGPDDLQIKPFEHQLRPRGSR
jgi:hypothetical protein